MNMTRDEVLDDNTRAAPCSGSAKFELAVADVVSQLGFLVLSSCRVLVSAVGQLGVLVLLALLVLRYAPHWIVGRLRGSTIRQGLAAVVVAFVGWFLWCYLMWGLPPHYSLMLLLLFASSPFDNSGFFRV